MPQKKIKIALMTKLESGSIVGSSEVNAARLFLQQKGALDKIEIIPFDDGWDPNKVISVYEEIRKEGIEFIITSHVSSCAVKLKDIVNEDKVFMFVTGAVTELISDKDDFIIRNVPDVISEQKQIAEFINKGNYKSVLVIKDIDNAAYTESAFVTLQKNVKGIKLEEVNVSIKGLKIVELEEIIKTKKYDLAYILVGGYNISAGTLAQLARKYEPDCTILFTPWMKTPGIVGASGNALEKAFMPSIYPSKGLNKNVDTYISSYQSTYGYFPTFISLNVYSALSIMYDGFLNKKTSAEELKDFIVGKTFDAEFGKVVFTKTGDVELPLYFISDIAAEFE